jgi:hypothetical protein
MASVLTWGPGWYHQKGNFTGQSNPLSTASHVMRYDVEVSGFPSQHAGHVMLLNLKEDDYPGTSTTEQWPTWTYPVLKWAKEQGAVTGYAHSGWGLEPMEAVSSLPNYVMPKMDGIGANEYIVTVTQGLIDFFSAGDTPPWWELNMWYHTLNAGFRARLSGESDFHVSTRRALAWAAVILNRWPDWILISRPMRSAKAEVMFLTEDRISSISRSTDLNQASRKVS